MKGDYKVVIDEDCDAWVVCEESDFKVLMYSEANAEIIAEKLNEKPLDLHEDFREWDNRLVWIDKTSRRLVEITELYQYESVRILNEAKDEGVDFKALYGGNNQQTMKQYVDEQLEDLLDEKQELELLLSDDKRRIDFLKHIVWMKLELLKFNGDGK